MGGWDHLWVAVLFLSPPHMCASHRCEGSLNWEGGSHHQGPSGFPDCVLDGAVTAELLASEASSWTWTRCFRKRRAEASHCPTACELDTRLLLCDSGLNTVIHREVTQQGTFCCPCFPWCTTLGWSELRSCPGRLIGSSAPDACWTLWFFHWCPSTFQDWPAVHLACSCHISLMSSV